MKKSKLERVKALFPRLPRFTIWTLPLEENGGTEWSFTMNNGFPNSYYVSLDLADRRNKHVKPLRIKFTVCLYLNWKWLSKWY